MVIDINGVQPKVTRVADMPAKLHWATATVIPDGKVVVTGGALKNTQLVGVNYRAFIWNPDNDRWTLGAPTVADASHARLYHSNALLLPDARILVGGGGAPGPTTNTNAEFYYPPLLFNSSGTAATRPIIIGAPTSLRIGRRFTLRVNRADSIRRVTLIKTGSVTHSFNMDQRFQELRIFARSNNTLTVTAPACSTIATPGYYLLYVLNAQNVPSVGRLLSLSASAD